MKMFIIKLFGLFGWLSGIAVAQLELSETVTSFVSFPDLGITCLGNLAVFFTSMYRGRLDLEMGARDVLATITGPKLGSINGYGLTTCKGDLKMASVVMLSTSTPNSSIRQYMRYISNAHDLETIVLQCFPLKSAAITAQICECNEVTCGCIVFFTVEEITIMLAAQMPGILKQLSDSLCILPCVNCIRRGCHGCNQGLLHVETDGFGRDRLTVGDSKDSVNLVCETLHTSPEIIEEERICICIPVHAADRGDDWTNLLIRSLMFKEKEARGVRVQVLDSQETSQVIVKYSTASLIVPRLIEVLVNFLLTGWFRLDGFSSSLISRRALRDYIVDSTGSGFAANAFIAKALLNSNADNTNANSCQVLTFRGTVLGIRTLSFIVGFGNLICSITWAVLIAIEGGAGKWYDSHCMPPSQVRLIVIMAAIGTALAMDSLDLFSLSNKIKGRQSLGKEMNEKKRYMLWAAIIMEIVCIVIGITVAGTWGLKSFGRWVYSAMLGLVWIKWGIGSYLLGEFSQEFDLRQGRWGPDGTGVVSCAGRVTDNTFEGGTLVYSSAFLLNAILAGARSKWKYVLKENN